MSILSPNCKVISSIIDNYDSVSPTLIYGNAAAGKTTLCLLASISAAETGKVIYVDTENGFSSERFKQLHGKTDALLDKVFLLQPKSFKNQHDTILSLKRLCENPAISLVIVDTIGFHYREEVASNPKEANQMMAEQMANLVRIGRDLGKIVLITNQASSKINGSNELNIVGGKLISKFCKVIIELNKIDSDRYATLIKSDKTQIIKQRRYDIKEKGLFLSD
ncbi:MAG: AAA family ATPase [archaeon]